MIYIMWFIIILLFVFVIFTTIQIIEYYYCVFAKHQAPFVPSARQSRHAIIQEIKTHYPNAKNIVEIGSGFGVLSRYIARKTKANVIGLENMPWCAFVSKFFDLFCFHKNQTIFCDAFEYLTTTDKTFDVAVAYLIPKMVPNLLKYKNKIRTLIVLDFPIPNLTPTRITDGGHGASKIGNKKYPHKLYIYEFK